MTEVKVSPSGMSLISRLEIANLGPRALAAYEQQSPVFFNPLVDQKTSVLIEDFFSVAVGREFDPETVL